MTRPDRDPLGARRSLVLDVSGLLRWSGPAVGIARTEHALAQAALLRGDTVLACWHEGRLRTIDPAWRDVLLGWSGALDPHRPQPPRTGWRRAIPGRQPAIAALERLRLTASVPVAAAAGLAQRAILAVRPHGFAVHDGRRNRVANVPPSLGLGAEIRLRPGDTVFSAGNGWFWGDPGALRALRHQHRLRTVVLCYDLLPITHPELFQPGVDASFAAYWRATLPVTDRCIVTADCIAQDLRRFCASAGIAVPEIVQLPLGYDPAPKAAPGPLPHGLVAGRYALLVGTIEPRKGHAMLLRAWQILLERGVPQASGFCMVFVGRPGWMVEPVLAALATGIPGIVHLPGVDDAVLDTLYGHAAFCLYPSLYEGFGLPVIEAFARGLPLIASTAPAVQELAADLAPCLDPTDATAWAAAIEHWITQPAALATAAETIRRRFSHPDWPTAAAALLQEAASPAREE